VQILQPANGSITSRGKSLPIAIRAQQRSGIQRVGYTFDGVITGGDSTAQLTSLPPDTTFADTLTIPDNASEGAFTLTGFAVDSSNRRQTTAPITISIQSAANDQTAPIVSFQIATRVEVDDSITVSATDPSGITKLGWIAITLQGATVGGDSATFAGNLTSVSQRWRLNFTGLTLPQTVVITAFAEDGATPPNRGTSQSTSGAPPAGAGPSAAASQAAQGVDTILVVNGITRALPRGGRVADAIYNRNRNEVYFTNVEQDRLEVFQVTDTTFYAPGIPVGSRPWGIALWPRNTATGTSADTVVVANSGGTNLSIVDVSAARIERRRHHLPNFLIQTVQTEIDGATGFIKLKITEYDFSDRPENLGMTCRTGGAPGACPANQVYAVYSTTPTAGQPATPVGFQNRGTVRWENLTSAAPSSHFFWEHAEAAPSPDTDTLQVVVDRGPSVAQETILSAACGVTVATDELAFLDTTFLRNSGDFTHALIGEGGTGSPVNAFARAIGYNASSGMFTQTCSWTDPVSGITFSGPEERDLGISPAIRVSDFIANTAIGVQSIGINFNGLTNLIRADSVYVLDEGLRLMGLVQVRGANPGMDLNFNHAFDARAGGTPGTDGGTGNPNNRLMFAASAEPQIDVFDTWFYGRVASVPIKDPVIGPLRVGLLPSGEQILVGVTQGGVVFIRLPAITNIFQARGWGAPAD
jgi:hypothetical protein